MRRAAAPRVCALLLLAACRPSAALPDPAASAACPRDARLDDHGRCACLDSDVPVLGACVPPSVADGYCGPVARATAAGSCAYPSCGPDEALDVDQGCLPLFSLHNGGPRSCAEGTSLVVEGGRLACVSADAACPRGTHAVGAACVHALTCPPGTLFTAGSCAPIVRRGADGIPRVDLPAWALLVLGADGGSGSPDLCRPLQARPLALGLSPGDSVTLRLHITLSVPDNDLSRVSAHVSATAPHVTPPDVASVSEGAVATLLEPLRGLGGEASASRVDVTVECRSRTGERSVEAPAK